MNPLEIGSFIISGIVVFWGIYQTRVTARLEKEIHRLNVQLNQRLQLLHRAREAAIQHQKTDIFIAVYRSKEQSEGFDINQYATKIAERSAAGAELRGLALLLEDKELLGMVSRAIKFPEGSIFPAEQEYEMSVRGKYQKIHKRISELIEAETQK